LDKDVPLYILEVTQRVRIGTGTALAEVCALRVLWLSCFAM